MVIKIKKEALFPERGTCLRVNNSTSLRIELDPPIKENILVINGEHFFYEKLTEDRLIIAPNMPYMIINRSKFKIILNYNKEIKYHSILYDPYKFENKNLKTINPEEFKQIYEVPDGYVDILAKWYSIKFTYPRYNLIYIKPEMGISIQKHALRDEFWEVLGGNPIILSGNKVYYFVKEREKFMNKKGDFHAIFNPNKGLYVILKESWSGQFDEKDIQRVFNPNKYG
ncbi:MAG: hypothetical protein ACTSXH_05945 [Promethearchaeota archaeon]